MADDKTPYDMLLEDNEKLRQEMAQLREEMQQVLGMNRSLLGRVQGGSNDTAPNVSQGELGKKLDGGLKHGRH